MRCTMSTGPRWRSWAGRASSTNWRNCSRPGERGHGMHRERRWRSRCLVEIEIGGEIPQNLETFPDVGSRIGSAIGVGVDPLTVQERVFDELVVGIEAENLVVDVALLRVRADDDAGHAQAVTIDVDRRWYHMVVEAAPVIPGQEDWGAAPIGARHDRIHQAGHIRLADADPRRRVLTDGARGNHPANRRQRATAGRGVEVLDRLDVAQLPVVLDRVEVGKRIPDAWSLRVLLDGTAGDTGGILTVGLGGVDHVVSPAHVVLEE